MSLNWMKALSIVTPTILLATSWSFARQGGGSPARSKPDESDRNQKTVAEAHVALASADTFEVVVGRLETAIGGPKIEPFESVAHGSVSWEDFEKKIEARLGPSGFMKFYEVDHGPWMALHGVNVKSKQYVIGNPLIARKIVPHDPAAGFYVPVRIGVYEDKQGKAWVQYDRPSASLGLSHDPRIDEVGRLLDDKLARLAEMATSGK
jgi:uncharacterized protein (DUF302 family)